MSKTTLVIHPKDPTTDCLSVIYKGRGWDVIRDFNTPVDEIARQIVRHDRIILLGHGSPAGLMAGSLIRRADGKEVFNRFSRLIVNALHAPILREKETVSIWCNSDAFFRTFKAGHGLHTGMIISEVGEELFCLGEAVLNETEMARNMELFCGAFAKYIDMPPKEMRQKVLEEYVGDDKVTRFNRERIIVL